MGQQLQNSGELLIHGHRFRIDACVDNCDVGRAMSAGASPLRGVAGGAVMPVMPCRPKRGDEAVVWDS